MDKRKKLQIQKKLASILIAIGIALQIFMTVVEDEPGALPLAMIVIGTAWFFTIRTRIHNLDTSAAPS